MSAPLIAKDDEQEPVLLEALPVMAWWVRGILVFITVCLTGVFAVAWLIRPYEVDGEIRETYPELGLPPCTFKYVTGLPCPSCGMTTSFALLMHGDLVNSLRANEVGTLLAQLGHQSIDVWPRPIGEKHRFVVGFQDLDVSRSVVLFVGAGPLVFLDQFALVVGNAGDPDHPDLRMLPHSLLVEVQRRS